MFKAEKLFVKTIKQMHMTTNAQSIKNNDRYWICRGKGPWSEVSERVYREAAKEVGTELPNGGGSGFGMFSGSTSRGLKPAADGVETKGRITPKKVSYKDYKDDPEFLEVLMRNDSNETIH